MSAGDIAAQDVRARPTDRSCQARSDEPLSGRVQTQHPAVLIDLEDYVRCAVHDGCELVTLALKRLAKPRTGKRDAELVARELRNAQSLGVQRSGLRRPQRQEGRRFLVKDQAGAALVGARP